MKYFSYFLILIFFASCSNFYEFKSKTTKDQETHRVFEMDLKKEKLDFKAYNDYYFDTINLSAVYLSKKELNQIKKLTVKSRNSQVLFLHNLSPFYLNIVGFYYPDLYLNEIHPPKIQTSTQSLTNGFSYHYQFNDNLISDFYVPKSNGILRIIAIGNPKKHLHNVESFWKEIDYVFYVLNFELFKLKNN